MGIKVYGVKAMVFLKYHDTMEELSYKVSKGLMIPKFEFDTDTDPPHELHGSSEALGFEIWLKKSSEIDNYQFLLELETELSLEESFHGQMHDISPWLARYISKICEIDVCIFDPQTQTYLSFIDSKFQEVF